MIYVLLFIIGIIFGSFYNVVGLRLSKEESIVFPPSHCTKCNHQLKTLDLIPIFSYIFLKGKCRYCKDKISIKYPIFEFITGVLFVLSYIKFSFTIEFLISIIFCSMLVIITVSDIDSFIIPDQVLLVSGVLLFAIYIFTYKTFAFDYLKDGVISFIFMYAVKLIGNFVFKKESMGDGDIKLMGVVGMVIGYKKVIIALFLAAYLGMPYAIYIMIKKNINHELPFGPFLSLASIILLFINFSFI